MPHPLFEACVLQSKRVESSEDFKNLIRSNVRLMVPHEAFVCGCGALHALGITVDYLIPVDFPGGYLQEIRNASGHIDTPVVRYWYENRTPVFVDPSYSSIEVQPPWLERFHQFGLRNLASDGFVDQTRGIATYFSFHNLPAIDTTALTSLFAHLTPLLHQTFVQVVSNHRLHQGMKPDFMHILSARDMEIVMLICQGKSNEEIAKSLSLAVSTIKNKVSLILEKTGCANRAGLAAEMGRQSRKGKFALEPIIL